VVLKSPFAADSTSFSGEVQALPSATEVEVIGRNKLV